MALQKTATLPARLDNLKKTRILVPVFSSINENTSISFGKVLFSFFPNQEQKVDPLKSFIKRYCYGFH